MLQRITATVNTQEQKRLLMDMDICKQSSDCPYTVQFYGALFREGDVWICMEVMDTSLDKFSAKVCHHGRQIPEDILGKIAFAVSFPILFNYVSLHAVGLNTYVVKCELYENTPHSNCVIKAQLVVIIYSQTFLIMKPTRCTNFSNLFLE